MAGLGLAGLCRRIPERLFSGHSLVVRGRRHRGRLRRASGGPFSHRVQHLLQGGLAPFRNISKFSPDVALPLAIGLAWMVSVPLWSDGGAPWRGSSPESRCEHRGGALAVVAVVVAAAPYWKDEPTTRGASRPSPTTGTQPGRGSTHIKGITTRSWCRGRASPTTPGGTPKDEPLQVVADTSVEWRSIIPLGSNGYIQMLDAVEQSSTTARDTGAGTVPVP